jgi:histone H3/H4
VYDLLGNVVAEVGSELFHTAKLFALNNKRVTPNKADFRHVIFLKFF